MSIANIRTRSEMEIESKTEDKEVELKEFMKEISKSLQEGNEFQASIPNLQKSSETSEKINLINLNFHLKNPENNVPNFDFTRQRIRSVGFAKTGLSILTPKRDLSRYLVWDPEKIDEEFMVKCAYLNQYLVQNEKQSLNFNGMKKFFEECDQDEEVFINSIVANDAKFSDFVKSL